MDRLPPPRAFATPSARRCRGGALDLDMSAEPESVVLARLSSAPLADAVPAVDGRDVEPGHRRVAVPYFTDGSYVNRRWTLGLGWGRGGGDRRVGRGGV